MKGKQTKELPNMNMAASSRSTETEPSPFSGRGQQQASSVPPASSVDTPVRMFPDPPVDLLDAVAAYIERDLVEPERGGELTVFDADAPPAISIRNYLDRIAEYACCSPECFTLAAVFAHRSGLRRTQRNLHRLLLAGVVVAAKWHDDWSCANRYYAKVGGVLLEEVNRLELALLQRTEWRLCISAAEFNAVTEHYQAFSSTPCKAVAQLPLSPPEFDCLTGTDPLRERLAAFTAAAAARPPGYCSSRSPGSSPRRRRLIRREVPATPEPFRADVLRAHARQRFGRARSSGSMSTCSPAGSCASGAGVMTPGMLAATGLTPEELDAGCFDTDPIPPHVAPMAPLPQRQRNVAPILVQGLQGPRIAP
eukprot:Hpha_TRINITY_DN16074_c1_g7::TRINITY_DN16074_c1_g7_i1::g.119554::m.119554